MIEDQRKYDRLYKLIMDRLNSKVVESTEEQVSMYDIIECVQSEMYLYNLILLNNLDKSIRQLNRNNGYTILTPKFVCKDLPRITDIANYITKEGVPYIHIMFTNGGKIVLTGDTFNVRVVSTDFASSETIDFLNYNTDIFSIYCGTMLEFNQNFPGIEMAWGKEVTNKMEQTLTDGFISYRLRPTSTTLSTPVFASKEHNDLALTHNKKHSELFDYIAFYSEEVLKKSKVSVNTLNPFIQECLNRKITLSNESNFTLSK